MSKRYKLMVWGPGRMGNLCIWEIAHSKEFELVGVRTYSEKKNGLDAGETIGIKPLGVKLTTDVDALLKIDCDCIIYVPHDMGTYHTDDELLKLLAAGKNVVTVLPYQSVHQIREAAFVEKLEAACKAGNSVFHATGIDPDWVSDRILLGLTGACADVKSIKLQENWDCSLADPVPLQYAGFGMLPQDAEKVKVVGAIAVNFLKAVVRTAEKVMGVKYDRVVETHDYIPTPVDIHEPFFIQAGKVGRLTHRLQCYVDAIGSDPFFTIEVNWVVNNSMLPEGIQPGQYYVATIEGRPSMKMVLDIRVSNNSDERVFKLGNQEAEPAYIATIVTCLQTIPHICAAAPGILPSFGPTLHWMQDLRDSVKH